MGFYGGVWDYQVPFLPRLFVRAYGRFGRWDESRAYTSLNPRPPSEPLQAGSNGSSEDDFVDNSRTDVWVEAPLRFLLPMGHGREREEIISTYTSLTPKWNPIPYIDLLGGIEIDWLQLVLFGEVGRVAADWDFSELHSDMKWDLGIGLRAMIQKGVFRVDAAGSTEGFRFVAMVGHPF